MINQNFGRKFFFDNITLIIPAYNPEDCIVELVSRLSVQGFNSIVVINDGSAQKYSDIFTKIREIKETCILHHKKNLGKGAALKSGFQYVFENLSHKTKTIITLDADGQHRVEDVIKIAYASNDFDKSLVLGVRDFSGSIPLRSKFGNELTKIILKLTNKVSLDDTQTGLRSIPFNFLREALKISSNGYAFELECLLLAKIMDLEIVQIPIKTIYINNNKSSHFRPVIDSMMIYIVFLRFVFISIASFLIDIVGFVLLYYYSSDIISSTYLARIFSGSLNFIFNKFVVFRSHKKDTIVKEFVYYIVLATAIATISAFTVNNITIAYGWNVTFIKIIVDLSLFIIGFLLQKSLIFRGSEGREKPWL